jgi:hypothetical protein
MTHPTLSPEHQDLIEGLRIGRFKGLDELPVQPGKVLDASEVHNPNSQAKQYLYFTIRETGEKLVVAVDGEFRLVSYAVRPGD